MVTEQTIIISNAHDGVAVDAENAAEIAYAIEFALRNAYASTQLEKRMCLLEFVNILHGKRRDGSEPAGDAA